MDGETICDPSRIANLFAEHYTRVGSDNNHDEDFLLHKVEREFQDIDFSSDNNEDYNRMFTLRELRKSIRISKSSSPGEDEIHYEFLKQLSETDLENMLGFYNTLWEYDQMTDNWNEVVIPVLKPNKDPYSLSSYRPIALTSCLSKVLERMVNERLTYYLESKNKNNKYQSGFRRCCSTYDALSRLETNIRETFLRNEYLIVISLDIEKAYDMVWHFGLLSKIRDMEVRGHMGNYVKNFLQNRAIKVRIGNVTSKTYKVDNGTPQGSVISPTLFSIMIGDLFKNCEFVEFALFADDGLMMLRTNDLDIGIEQMQSDVKVLEHWSQTNGLKFSAVKTKCIIFSKRPINNPSCIVMNDQEIEYVEKIRYLGIIFDKTLTWKDHLEFLKSSCMKKLLLMKTVSRKSWGADRKCLKMLYESLIQSKINYASFLFDSAAECHLKKLDRIQYEGIRICTGALKCTRTDYLEVEADIMPLKYRRKLIGLNYYGRSISIRQHTSRELFNDYYNFQFYLLRPHPLPFVAYVKETLDRLALPVENIECIDLKDVFLDIEVDVRYNMKLDLNKQENPVRYKAHFLETFDELYTGYLDIYTDGSKKENLVGYSFWTGSNFHENGRIRDRCGIFTAELYAILRALLFIGNYQGQNRFVIFCDSYSALQALETLHSRNSLVIRIKKKCRKLKCDGKEIILEWIPSHVGISGNEMADKKAKESLNLSRFKTLPYSYEDFKYIMKSDILKQWQQEWDQFNSHLHQIKPKLGNMGSSFNKNRRNEVAISRLRLGCTLIDVKHLFERTAPLQCNTCNTRCNSKHLILFCPDFANFRTSLVDYIRDNNLIYSINTMLQDTFPMDLLLVFLNRSGIIRYL